MLVQGNKNTTQHNSTLSKNSISLGGCILLVKYAVEESRICRANSSFNRCSVDRRNSLKKTENLAYRIIA